MGDVYKEIKSFLPNNSSFFSKRLCFQSKSLSKDFVSNQKINVLFVKWKIHVAHTPTETNESSGPKTHVRVYTVPKGAKEIKTTR